MATAAADTTATAAAAGGENESPSSERVLCVSLNDDHSIFAVGTTYGYYVFNVHPWKRRFFRDWGSGVGIVEVYKKSNIVALVGSETASRFSPNKLTIWDDWREKVVVDVDFHSKIVAMHLRQERILVATSNSVYVLNFKDLSTLATYSASMEPRTLAISTSDTPVFAFSDFVTSTPSGILKIKRETTAAYPQVSSESAELGSSSQNDILSIPAHNGKITCISLSRDGKLAATASDKGTLVRVWDTETGKMIKELRRGAEYATIWAMCFSDDNSLLAVASSRGTCHIFGIVGVENKQSVLYSLGGMLSYFGSQWSSMKVDVPCEPCCLSFSADKQSLFVISYDGTYRRIELNWGIQPPTAVLDPQNGAVSFLKK